MKAIFYLVAAALGFWSFMLFAKGFSAFSQAAATGGPEAQGGGFGVILFAVIVAFIAWKSLTKARG